MKVLLFAALLALACATPIEIRKGDKKPDEKPDESRGLQWPLPDARSEGDLILHGSHLFDRVEELRKAKVENDVDKMILEFGRNFLRKAQKYLEANPEFKILPVLCKDSRDLNSTRRWEIRIQPEHQPADQNKEQQEQNKQEKQPGQNEQPKQENKPQNDSPAQDTKQQQQQQQPQNDQKPAPAPGKDQPKLPSGNATEPVNATDAPVSPVPKPEHDSYEAQRADWYRRMGENFARLLMKRYRKETLVTEENDYLDDWLEEPAIHYGVMGIYCQEGENVKEILKKIVTYVEDK